jgi:hypothetical protein
MINPSHYLSLTRQAELLQLSRYFSFYNEIRPHSSLEQLTLNVNQFDD